MMRSLILTTLIQLLERIVSLRLTKHRCHRIPIMDNETKRCSSIITQSALVKALIKVDLPALV